MHLVPSRKFVFPGLENRKASILVLDKIRKQKIKNQIKLATKMKIKPGLNLNCVKFYSVDFQIESQINKIIKQLCHKISFSKLQKLIILLI